MTARSTFSVNRRRRLVAGAAAIMLACGLVATSAAAASAAHPSGPQPQVTGPASDIAYAINKPLCSTTLKAGQMSCLVMQRVQVKKGTPGAYAYLKNSITPGGPAGGYSPANLASLFHYDPTTPSKKQTVGIVDWYDDPHIASDLAAFDTEYGFPSETAKSFRKVDQTGAKSPLPSSSKGKSSADEIALDVETVRGVCETCRILLVEAKAPLNSDIAIAENTAVRLGATEVSNSFGGPEGAEGATVLKAFNHPGVVITASTGDDGWYDWDFANNSAPPDESASAALFPSTDPDVVAVGGIGNDGTDPQYVWNNDGADDVNGIDFGRAEGAGGGGCSQVFTAKSFQSSFAGYTATGCSGKRLAADVSALADPATGFDEYDTWGGSGWITVGGTSLAAPMVAAMYALAGGSGGAAYPAQTIYENASRHPSTLTDITEGGNGFCGGDTTANCGETVFNATGTHNPNALGLGELDCSFPRDNSDPVTAPPLDSECNAVAGFDGPSGVGTPKGVGLFTSTSPKITLTTPKVLRLHHSASFSAHATELLSGAHITKYVFNWGDGHSTTGTSTTATHTYTKAGTHTVVLTVTDSVGQQSVARAKLTVGKTASIKIFRSKGAIKAGHKIKFEAVIVDPNTGGKIKKVKWNWGDHKHSSGLKTSHKWHKAGKYTLTVTVTDSAGIKTTFTAKIKVKK